MVTVVPDASVILKWVLPGDDEPFSRQALALRQHYTADEVSLVVPTLWRFEIGNTLARRFPEDAGDDLRDLQAMGMSEPALSDQWLTQALSLTRRFSVAFYDAAYHALAIVESGVFVTADERYLRAVGDADNLCHLADWQL